PVLTSVFPSLASRAPWIANVQRCLDPLKAFESVMLERTESGHSAFAAYSFPLTMLAVTGMLAGWGIARLRVWNPSGEPVIQRERPEDEDLDRSRAHAAPGMVRTVWANPILWRGKPTPTPSPQAPLLPTDHTPFL